MEATFSRSRKDSFSSRIGFILAAAGSAIGLANIWKFPYIVGKFGGGGFILLYLIFLALVGIPAFLSEIIIGKTTQKPPALAFHELGKTKFWGKLGQMTIWTGFLVSSFYSVVAGWIVGYLFEAICGNLHDIHDISSAHHHYAHLIENPFWTVFFHALFMGFCLSFLLGGIKRGIELCNKLFMPFFFLILILFAGYTSRLPSADTVWSFLTSFDVKSLPAAAIIIALGHAFFTLSIGQGTLVTYGSYLNRKETVLSNSLLVVLADTLVSLLAAFCVISIVFSANMELDFGPGLIFETLPIIFSQLPWGHAVAILFFFFVFIAALTSQVSALEPMIAHLTTKKFERKQAVLIVCGASFLLGLPSALSTNILKECTFFGHTFLDLMSALTTSFLIPLGGLAAVLLVAWRWGMLAALQELHVHKKPLRAYFILTMKITAPLLIILVFLHAIGLFS